MLLIVSPFTSIDLSISPFEDALAMKVPMQVLSVVAVAAWISLQTLPILCAFTIFALVHRTIDPSIFTEALHFSIFHFTRVDITILHVSLALSLAPALVIEFTSPDCLGLFGVDCDIMRNVLHFSLGHVRLYKSYKLIQVQLTISIHV